MGRFNWALMMHMFDRSIVGKNCLRFAVSVASSQASLAAKPSPDPKPSKSWELGIDRVGFGHAARALGSRFVAAFTLITILNSVPFGGIVLGQACDLDGDRDCDLDDIDQLSWGIRMPFDPQFDIDGDGEFDVWEDTDYWLETAGEENGFAASFLRGDANLDGSVNVFDLNAVGKALASSRIALESWRLQLRWECQCN